MLTLPQNTGFTELSYPTFTPSEYSGCRRNKIRATPLRRKGVFVMLPSGQISPTIGSSGAGRGVAPDASGAGLLLGLLPQKDAALADAGPSQGYCLVVVPTYNEALNIERLIGAILSRGPQFDVLVVDDN